MSNEVNIVVSFATMWDGMPDGWEGEGRVLSMKLMIPGGYDDGSYWPGKYDRPANPFVAVPYAAYPYAAYAIYYSADDGKYFPGKYGPENQ